MSAVRREQARRANVLGALLLLTMFLGAPNVAGARTKTVPDDFPTIQAAVDNMPEGAPVETLLVRSGSYPEQVRVDRNVVVLAIPALDGTDRMPEIGGLAAGGDAGDRLTFVGLRFTGRTYDTSYSPDNLAFIDCRFDGGYAPGPLPGLGLDTNSLQFTRCTFFGTTVIGAWVATMESCTAYGPVAVVGIDHARILDNRFENITGLALFLAYSRYAVVARNRVRGGDDAFRIYLEDGGEAHLEDNDIEGCRGWGISSSVNSSEHIFLERNRVVRCGRFGIHTYGVVTARGNIVQDCGGPGIEVVQEAGGAGLIEENVVGRCNGVGISVQDAGYPHEPSTFEVRGNTVYACNGPAIAIASVHESTISNNIFYACLGLSASGSATPVMSNNDWFPAYGPPLSSTDLSVDPHFCDIANNDVRLMSDSPLLDLPAGRIGALGQGCEAPVVAMGFQLWPRVLQPASRSRWVTACIEPPSQVSVAEVDVASVRVNDIPVAPGSEAIVGDQDLNGVPDLQLRFDRAALEKTLAASGEVTVTVTGRVGRRSFSGTDKVRVLRYTGGPRSEIPRNALRDRALAIRAPFAHGVASGLGVEFSLVDESPAELAILDVAGRVVHSRDVGVRGSGEQALDLADTGLAQGIYFLRLRQGAREAQTRCVVVR